MNALKRAAEILREDAENIREGHTLGGDWQSEDKAKADHDEMLAVAEQLEALHPDGKENAVLQAQTWAQEARTQKSIVDEIGKLVGCSNDWEMVKAVKAALQQTAPAVPEGWKRLVSELIDCLSYHAAYDKCCGKPDCDINDDGTPGGEFCCGQHIVGMPSDAEELACKARAMLTAAPQPDHSPDAGKVVPFQTRVDGWMQECFGPEISADQVERNHRFLEEALELVQALGCTKDEAHKLVDYVYGRAVGDPPQEVGGVMVTLAALCLANGMDMDAAAETELSRILQPEVVTKIREKQKRKPAFSPLPGSYPDRAPAADGGEVEVNRVANAILEAWKKAEPDHSITKHPISYIATFADMARAAIAATHPAQPRNEDAEAREEIKADAERYRWLKAQYHREYCPLTIAQRVAGGLFEWAVEDPSSAIDAARLRSNGGDV